MESSCNERVFPTEIPTVRRFWIRQFGVVAAFAMVMANAAEAPSVLFINAYNLIQQADSLEARQPVAALEKYLQAQQSLKLLKENHPTWNADVVEFRQNYLVSKVAPLMVHLKIPDAPPNAQSSTGHVAKIAKLELELEQTRADKAASESALRAKLKEALAARPRELEPGELAKAEQKIQTMQEELVFLKAHYEKGKDGVESLRLSLEKSRRDNETLQKLVRETPSDELFKKLQEDNKRLQERVVDLVRQLEALAEIQSIQEELEAVKKELAAEKKRSANLAKENQKLERLLTTPQ